MLDIILESFECQLDQHAFFIELLRLFTPDSQTMNELLGFKFKFYLSDVSYFYHDGNDGFNNVDLQSFKGFLSFEMNES